MAVTIQVCTGAGLKDVSFFLGRCEDESFTPGGKRKRKKRSHDDDDFNSDDEGDRDDDVELYSMIESPMSAASSNVPNDGKQISLVCHILCSKYGWV